MSGPAKGDDAERAAAEHAIAETVRRRLLAAALAAWEEAGISGLCAEGRWECAVRALRETDLGDLSRGGRP